MREDELRQKEKALQHARAYGMSWQKFKQEYDRWLDDLVERVDQSQRRVRAERLNYRIFWLFRSPRLRRWWWRRLERTAWWINKVMDVAEADG